MQPHLAPLIRIILRYVIGAVFVGAAPLAERLASDPDVVMLLAAGLGALVELFYAIAKRKGWAT